MAFARPDNGEELVDDARLVSPLPPDLEGLVYASLKVTLEPCCTKVGPYLAFCVDIGDSEIDLMAGSSCAARMDCVMPAAISAKGQQN